MRAAPERWSLAQRRLHGWGAVLVLLTLALSLAMVALPMSQLLAKFLAYQLHKTFGLLVLILTLARLGYRLARPAPAPIAGGHPAARIGQGVLYALLLVVPLLGYATAQAAPGPVPTTLFLVIPVPHVMAPDAALYAWLRPTHQAAAWGLVALAAGHAAMAIWHHARGMAVLRRMWR